MLSRHVDAIGVRTGPDETLEELAAESSVPVFNMLTAGHHPCQALADLLTLREAFGRLDGLKLAYVGDGNNVARSLAVLGDIAGVEVVIASPEGYALAPVAGATLVSDPAEAVTGAHAVYGDVWVSMGDEETADDAPRRTRPVPHRRRAPGPGRAGSDRAALPARPPRRGDHRGGALRRPAAHLGPGGEPPPCTEGAARAAHQELIRTRGGAVGIASAQRPTCPGGRRDAAAEVDEVRGHAQARSAQARSQEAAAAAPRSAAAKKPAARKPAARKATTSRSTARKPAARKAPAKRGAGSNIEAVRERLSDRIVITRDRLQELVDDAVKTNKMQRADANKFVKDLVSSSRKQTQDILADIEQLIGRAGKELEIAATDARKQATRRGEKALRQVDKVRRHAQPSAFPITGYDDLTASQIVDRISDLTAAQLRKVRDFENKNSSRKSVLTAIERKLK